MKTILLSLGCLAVLAGCATPMSDDQAARLAKSAPDWELCYATIRGSGPSILLYEVRLEMIARRTDCNQHMAMVNARLASDAARASAAAAQSAAGWALIQQAAPRPAPQTNTTANCRTYNRGTYLQTVCD